MRSTFGHAEKSREMRSTFGHGETRREMRSKASTPTPTPKQRETVAEIMMSLSDVDHVVTSAKPSNFEAMLYIFLKTMKQWSRWSGQVEVRRWDTCPEPTELYLIGWETSRKTSLLVVWHARTRDKVRGKILWTGEKECWGRLYKVSTPCLYDHHLKREELEAVQCMLTNCLEMLVFGQKWRTWHSLVCKQTCTSCLASNEWSQKIRRSIVDWDCSETQTVLETLRIQNLPRVEFSVSSGVEHSFL